MLSLISKFFRERLVVEFLSEIDTEWHLNFRLAFDNKDNHNITIDAIARRTVLVSFSNNSFQFKLSFHKFQSRPIVATKAETENLTFLIEQSTPLLLCKFPSDLPHFFRSSRARSLPTAKLFFQPQSLRSVQRLWESKWGKVAYGV